MNDDAFPAKAASSVPIGDALFRHLVENVRDYAIILLSQEGTITSWNAGAQHLKGYAPHEAIGRHFSMLYPASAVEAGWPDEELRRAAKEGRFEDEGWRRRKDGGLFWANVIITAWRDASGTAIAYSKITRDLTERRQHEQQLLESEQNLRLMIEGVKDHAIFSLDADGSVASWNAGAQRLLGYDAQRAVGLDASAFYNVIDRAAGAPEANLETARQVGFFQTTGWRVRSDGTQLWADVTITALRNGDKSPRGFVEVVHDLTERRRAKALEMEGQRVHEFIAMLSHELRNPLAPINNSVHVLRRTVFDSTPLALIEVIGRQTALLSRLVDDLLDVSRISSGKVRVRMLPIDLGEIVMSTVDSLRASIQGKGHSLRTELDGRRISIRGDAVRLTQVVVNLLSNAIKYTPPGGRIDVRLTCVDDDAVLQIEDTGVGMAEDLRQNAFEPFVQGHRDPGHVDDGLGIGLTLVKRLVELHGGSVSVRSQPGQGSTFTVALPLSDPEHPASTEPQSARSVVSGKRKVLVVDDNCDTAESLALYLRMLGHEVLVAHSGTAALDLARSGRPEVALLDLALPGMDGFEIARRIKSAPDLSDMRLIALSGFGQDSDRIACASAGFATHMVKPYSLDRLAQLIVADPSDA